MKTSVMQGDLTPYSGTVVQWQHMQVLIHQSNCASISGNVGRVLMDSTSHNFKNANFNDLGEGAICAPFSPLFFSGCKEFLVRQNNCRPTVTFQVIFERTLLLSVGHKL